MRGLTAAQSTSTYMMDTGTATATTNNEPSTTTTNPEYTTVVSSLNTSSSITELSQHSKKAGSLRVHTVICCAVLFMVMGHIVVPIVVAASFAFQFEVYGIADFEWTNGDNIDSIDIARCNDDECVCNDSADNICLIEFEGSYVETSFALNTMVLVVETLWFIRTCYGLKRHSLCTKLGVFEAMGGLTRDSKCCLFIWRTFELAWFIVIVLKFDHDQLSVDCHLCDDQQNDHSFEYTMKGIYFQMAFIMDIVALSAIFLHLLSKCTFILMMEQMTKSKAAYYDMGAFFAVLKVQYVDGYSYRSYDDSISIWSPLKQSRERKLDKNYEAKTLHLHYKGWK